MFLRKVTFQDLLKTGEACGFLVAELLDHHAAADFLPIAETEIRRKSSPFTAPAFELL